MHRALTVFTAAALGALALAACGPTGNDAPVAAPHAATSTPDGGAPAASTTSTATVTSPPAPTKTTPTKTTPTAATTSPPTKPTPKPTKKAEHANAEYFALLKGVEVDNAGVWWVTYDRAYFCFGEDDEPGCEGPNPIPLDDGSWIINNNPSLTRSKVLPSATLSLYVPGHTTPFTQGLPTGRGQDERGGIHWADTKNKGGIYGVVRYDKTGKVRTIEQYYTP